MAFTFFDFEAFWVDGRRSLVSLWEQGSNDTVDKTWYFDIIQKTVNPPSNNTKSEYQARH